VGRRRRGVTARARAGEEATPIALDAPATNWRRVIAVVGFPRRVPILLASILISIKAAQPSTEPASFVERRQLRAQRADAVLAAAASTFSARGYHDASMDEIARAAGVSKPAVYAQFGSKDELYVACVQRAAEKFHVALEQAVRAAETPEERLWAGVLTLLDHVEQERSEWTMLFDDSARTGAVAEETAGIRRRTERLISDLFTDTAVSGGIGGSALEAMDPLGAGFVGTSEGIARWWLDHPEVPKENVAMYFMNYLWSGLGGMIEGRLWVPPA
jgi:AcrR family transcriptional regulator